LPIGISPYKGENLLKLLKLSIRIAPLMRGAPDRVRGKKEFINNKK